MKPSLSSDKFIGLGIVLFSMVLYLFVIPRECDTTGSSGIGPDFFPKLIAGIMGALGICLFFNKSSESEKKKKERHTAQMVVTAVMLLLYTYLAEYLGYISSTVLILFFFLIYFGFRSKIWVPIIVLVVTGSLYLFFGHVMQVMLPRGIFI